MYFFFQEDMDSMQKELEMWKEENKDHQIALKREQRFEDMTICTFNMCYLFNMFVTNTVQKKQN
jgi:thiamine pyrophosphokinase